MRESGRICGVSFPCWPVKALYTIHIDRDIKVLERREGEIKKRRAHLFETEDFFSQAEDGSWHLLEQHRNTYLSDTACSVLHVWCSTAPGQRCDLPSLGSR